MIRGILSGAREEAKQHNYLAPSTSIFGSQDTVNNNDIIIKIRRHSSTHQMN